MAEILKTIQDFITSSPYYFSGIVIILFLVWVFIRDITQKKHTLMHNFPVVGHLRYFLEQVGPELRQYIVANDKEESPFNRAERRWIYASAKGQNKYFGFGTTELLYGPGYPIIKNSVFPVNETTVEYPFEDKSTIPCLKVMGLRHKRRRPYRAPSVINISAMSFGSLGYRAISALNQGAKQANCFHNTGEGSLSKYHDLGADIMLQIGTGYFGVRDESGNFSMERLKELVESHPRIRAIEIKMSQGAKPGKGGVLPGAKVTAEIAETRGIPQGRNCISPNTHSQFHDPETLIDFIEEIADATGLPVGIKCAVGKTVAWEELAKKMARRKAGPDFITIDGGEGGTGAAPLTYADHVSLPFKTAFTRIYTIFQKQKLSKHIVWIGAGKLGFPDRAIVAFAMGVDIVYIAREAMISIGCIQAQKCHTDECPAGIATQNKWLQGGLDIENKAIRFSTYVKSFRDELLSLSHTAGYLHPGQFTGNDIEVGIGLNRFETLAEDLGYLKDKPVFTSMEDLRE